ncbi:unnamed protein product [Cylindrotheca closterium]|uniref:Uncharacterized protein n=1 Tax=Cylindrotheca closterium TaxID=2856 RepID=A0AAD2FBL4_9STRA|nr:unnamed protein product [Cylindrotheca closterium]
MLDDEYYYHDDYPYLLDEEEDSADLYLNTIWEECTADLISKSTVATTSPSLGNISFSSFSDSAQQQKQQQHQELLDRQYSQDSLFSAKSEPSKRLNAAHTNDSSEEDGDGDHADCSNDSSSSSHKSNRTIELLLPSNHPLHHESPKSLPMELMLAMKNNNNDENKNDNHSKHLDFSGAVIMVMEHPQQQPRESKRERIRSKMKAIEEKVVEARDLLITKSISNGGRNQEHSHC